MTMLPLAVVLPDTLDPDPEPEVPPTLPLMLTIPGADKNSMELSFAPTVKGLPGTVLPFTVTV
jgi:hypothetical protein